MAELYIQLHDPDDTNPKKDNIFYKQTVLLAVLFGKIYWLTQYNYIR